MAERERRPPTHPTIWNTPPRGRVLVLVPHTDDETLGCGGILIQHRDQGDLVKVVFATDGGAGDALGYYAGQDYRALRREEAQRAAAVMGVDDLVFWDYPDGKLVDAQGLAERLEALFVADRPDIIYRPSTQEIHPDHWALGVGVEEALRRYTPAIGDFCYELWATVQPSHVIDISAVWHRKRKAIEQYQSQLRYSDYLRVIEGLNAFRTLFLPSARYVEAFRVGHCL